MYKLHISSEIDLETLVELTGRAYSSNDFAIVEIEILRSLEFQILFEVASDILDHCSVTCVKTPSLSTKILREAYMDMNLVRKGPRKIADEYILRVQQKQE